jgi:hypothetical protein
MTLLANKMFLNNQADDSGGYCSAFKKALLTGIL